MKFFLFSLSILVCSAVLAQDLPKKKFRGALPGDQVIKQYQFKKPVNNSTIPSLTVDCFNHPFETGLKLMKLPQDNMLCVVPDLSLYRMPNAGSELKFVPGEPGSIPNPGLKKEEKLTQ